ncbi:MAG: YggT family protein [Alphaproteobacteria bacterium]|nr:YggT family protein [Alphaproteobacteria bacterium]
MIGNALVGAFLEVLYAVLNFYVWILIVGAVLSWLVAFDIVNPYNRVVRAVGDMIARITEPALRQVRRIIPPMGGVDLSPLALIFIIYFIQSFIRRLVF